MSKEFEKLTIEATMAFEEGRFDDAAMAWNDVLRFQPDDVGANLKLGMIHAKRNEPALAVPFLERVLELEPESFDASFWLAAVFRKQGRTREALAMALNSVAKNGGSGRARNQLGMCLMETGRYMDAEEAFRIATSLDPTVSSFFENLGFALQTLGRTSDAIEAYKQALAVGPVRTSCLYRLGSTYLARSQVKEATDCGRSILGSEPNSYWGNLLLAGALIEDDFMVEGAIYAQKAMRLAPREAKPALYNGLALQSLGRIEEADEMFKRAIELEPRQGIAYHSLVRNHKVTAEEGPLIIKMRELSEDFGLPISERILLQYGLGKASEDLNDFGAAMGHYNHANDLVHQRKSSKRPFDSKEFEESMSQLLQTFDSEMFEKPGFSGNESPLPIFVVGMNRSGTTLAEQILSSHPDVGGAGEQPFWPANFGSRERLFGADQTGSINLGRLSRLSTEYLTLLTNLCPGKQRVVDKMTANYLLLGFLHIAFPNARVIHMKRHPVDTCISIWANPLAATEVDLSADKGNLVVAYQQYLRVMEHWRRVLPPSRLLEVRYEDLVEVREPTTRSMIQFCGLEWNEACLRPQDNVRSVRTPSLWQVRQPVYKTSVERWRKFEPWLGEFASLLYPEVQDLGHGRVKLAQPNAIS